jgi:ribosomal protein S18 acetylase RimI-like enzyme
VHVVIREYRKEDWPAICRIHDRARAIEVSGFMPRDIVLPMQRIAAAEGFFESQTFVACIDHSAGEIAGFISIRLPEITWCYVNPSLHRQGIGRKLVEQVLPMIGSDGFVLTVAENPAALEFYKSLGFIIAARFPGEAQGYRCECVRLTLPTSVHRHRPPTPSPAALRLAGFSEKFPGNACLGADGIYYWR